MTIIFPGSEPLLLWKWKYKFAYCYQTPTELFSKPLLNVELTEIWRRQPRTELRLISLRTVKPQTSYDWLWACGHCDTAEWQSVVILSDQSKYLMCLKSLKSVYNHRNYFFHFQGFTYHDIKNSSCSYQALKWTCMNSDPWYLTSCRHLFNKKWAKMQIQCVKTKCIVITFIGIKKISSS